MAAIVAARPRGDASAMRYCAHCGQPLRREDGRFCCSGCAGAYQLIQDLHLDRYYDGRTLDRTARLPKPPEEAPDVVAYAVAAQDGTSSLGLMIDGLHCPACVWLIETALRRQPEVIEARVNLTTRRLRLRWRGSVEDGMRLADLVRRLGYRVVAYDPQRIAQLASREEKRLLRSLAVAGFAAGNVMLLSVAVWSGSGNGMGPATRDLLHWVSALIALPAVAYAGQPFFRSAWNVLRRGYTNMDVPISIGVVLATAVSLDETLRSGDQSYFESATMLLFFLLIGRYLDLRARGRARSAAEQLVGVMAQPATVLDGNGVAHRVLPSSITVGDTVLVAAGERVAVDGRVIEGRSSVDKSLIDGEILPAEAAPGTTVLAGMLNLAAPLRLAATAVGDKTFLAEIVRMMEAAEQGRARLVVLADRVARYYAPVVHVLALATFVAWAFLGPLHAALLNAVAVLIITCPCALGLAVPTVQIVASGRLMRRGVLLKSATALERLAEVDTVVFDKTGTLTLGKLELEPAEHRESLRLAASLAAASRHPLSQALTRACPDVPGRADVSEHPGAGLSAGDLRLGSRAFCGITQTDDDGTPELWLTQPGKPPTRFVFRDAFRPDAAAVVHRLKLSGMRVLLLSGDRRNVVASVAHALSIEEWRAGVSPQEKCAALQALGASGRKVLMVGDGLNDAPALAAAFVSMSPSTAADVAQTAADFVFQGMSLRAVDEALGIARDARFLVRENIACAIVYNGLAVPLAMIGLVTPLLAALAMSSSSLIVIGNALRLARRRT